jgi:hypothetical protein
MVPLYGFLHGDTLGLVVLVHDSDRVSKIVSTLQEAASVRVAPRPRMRVVVSGRPLDPELTIAEAGLRALDRVDVMPEPS